MKLKKIFIAVGLFIIMAAGVVFYYSHTSETKLDFTFSNLNETKEKDIYLNPDINKLNLNGTVSLSEGKVILYVKVKEKN